MTKENIHPPLKAALLGGGVNSAVGRVHDTAMRMDHQFELVAGCFSRDPLINQKSGEEYRISQERVYANIAALLAAEKDLIDVVIVALPTDQHAQAIEAAISYGLNVITDKPTVSTVSDAKKLQATLDNNTAQVFTLFNYTGYPMVRQMRHMLQQNTLGKIHRIMIEMPQDSFLRMKNQSSIASVQNWRLTDGDICGVSLDLFTHIHSLVKFLNTASPVSAIAKMRSVSQISNGLIDDVDALIDYDDGSVLSAWYGKTALGYRNGLRVRIFGEKGSLEWLQMDPEHLKWADEIGNIHTTDRLSPDAEAAQLPHLNRFKAGHPSGFIEAFANCYYDIALVINSGAEDSNSVTHINNTIEGLTLAAALQISHTTGQHHDL